MLGASLSDARSRGPCYAFEDPSGNRLAIFEMVRPHPFEGQKE